MKTVKDVYAACKDALKPWYDEQEINSITTLLLNDVTGLNKARLKAFPETTLTANQELQIEDAIAKLKTGMPLQYVLGTAEFYGLTFKVNPSVLIPRPETEELVAWIIDTVKQSGLNAGCILDIGTGSGCIPIALKKHLPAFEITSIDISADALQAARENAELNQVNVNLIQADVLQPETSKSIAGPFDIIVSNPPYVTLDDKKQMHVNVVDFEPHTALFVPEEDPLVFYRHIADFANLHLKPGGRLFFEINESLGEETLQLISNKYFINKELRKDFREKDRMIAAEKFNAS
jgi:release factor glutamine methyltransferase